MIHRKLLSSSSLFNLVNTTLVILVMAFCFLQCEYFGINELIVRIHQDQKDLSGRSKIVWDNLSQEFGAGGGAKIIIENKNPSIINTIPAVGPVNMIKS